MIEFEFQLFCLGLDTRDEGFLDRLYEAGCGDATVYFKDGYACLDFARRAASAEQAILSAIRDFQGAGTGGTVERVEPEDLASLSEIARRVGVTRASLQKYARGDSKVGKDFPAPVQNLSQPRRELFSTYQVMRWMLRRRRADLPADALELYGAIDGINKALEIRRAGKDRNVGRLVALLSADPRYIQPNPSR
ncbi:MAG: hypothetical protein RQ826_02070 [Xanthomonadales bacterium]|nr:hypothetical protein [Xanthomonadales bacterium]